MVVCCSLRLHLTSVRLKTLISIQTNLIKLKYTTFHPRFKYNLSKPNLFNTFCTYHPIFNASSKRFFSRLSILISCSSFAFLSAFLFLIKPLTKFKTLPKVVSYLPRYGSHHHIAPRVSYLPIPQKLFLQCRLVAQFRHRLSRQRLGIPNVRVAPRFLTQCDHHTDSWCRVPKISKPLCLSGGCRY